MAVLVPKDQSAWVRTDIRLPNANERVLVCDKQGFVRMGKLKYIAHLDKTTEWCWAITGVGDLVHLDFMPYWRPLPAPPINLKKEDNNNDL